MTAESGTIRAGQAAESGTTTRRTRSTEMTPVIKHMSNTIFGNDIRRTRRQCWSAISKDGVWGYIREEEPGTPWYIKHLATGQLVGGTFGTLNRARLYTGRGFAAAKLVEEPTPTAPEPTTAPIKAGDKVDYADANDTPMTHTVLAVTPAGLRLDDGLGDLGYTVPVRRVTLVESATTPTATEPTTDAKPTAAQGDESPAPVAVTTSAGRRRGRLPISQIQTLCAASRGDLIRTASGVYLTTAGRSAGTPAAALARLGLIERTGELVVWPGDVPGGDLQGEGVRPTGEGYSLLASYGIGAI